jgi:hypothetical protein
MEEVALKKRDILSISFGEALKSVMDKWTNPSDVMPLIKIKCALDAEVTIWREFTSELKKKLDAKTISNTEYEQGIEEELNETVKFYYQKKIAVTPKPFKERHITASECAILEAFLDLSQL